MSVLTFLNDLYNKTQDDDLGAILGDLDINPHDNLPNDPRMKQIWFRIAAISTGINTAFLSKADLLDPVAWKNSCKKTMSKGAALAYSQAYKAKYHCNYSIP